MISRYAFFALLLVAQWVVPAAVEARTMSRKEIRQTPILERPSRPGHFYGNAVRRSGSRAQSGAIPQNFGASG